MSPGCYTCTERKVLNRKTLSGETLCFFQDVWSQYLNFVLQINYCFFLLAADWPTTTFLRNVLLFSCNVIGQLCLSGPAYSSCTVISTPI